jgi:hypothetical protein
MDNKSSGGVTIGFTGLLTLVFIILKLCGVISWSWLWVLAPAWIPLALGLVIIGVIYIGAAIAAASDKKKLK